MKWTFIDNENGSTNIKYQESLAKKIITNTFWLEKKIIIYTD